MATINGTSGDDVLTGTPQGDTINGGDGNDTITDTGPGTTVINGGAGADRIRFSDYLNGSLDAFITIDAGTGDDVVWFDSFQPGAASRVAITLGDGNDVLNIGTTNRNPANFDIFSYGYSRPMSINLGTGNDRLVLGYHLGLAAVFAFETFDIGGTGVPRVSGFTAGAGGDVVDVGDLVFGIFLNRFPGQWNGTANPFTSGFLHLVQVGNDVSLRFDSNGLADTSTATELELLRLTGVQVASLTAANFGGYDPNGAALAAVTIDGTSGNDTLRSVAARNTVNGFGGDDTIIGYATPDILNGGDGRDTISGGFGDDAITGGEGDDTIDGGAGNDVIDGGDGNDTIEGGVGNDQIDGGAGNDLITDNRGNDTVRAGAGNDRIIMDRPVFVGPSFTARGPETVVIEAGEGNDEVNFLVNGGRFGFNLFESSTTLTVDLGAGDDTFTFGGLGSFARITTGAGRDRINMLTFGLSFTLTDFQAGNSGDVIDLTELVGPYVEYDFSVNPFSTGVLQMVQNGTDAELWFDQDGTSGFAPRELLVTFENTTATAFTAANFRGLAPDGSATAPSTINGTSGDDVLTGGLGADTISGRGGNDTLRGDGGNDVLDGGDGNDRIEGGYGSDRLTGGAGDDTFIITTGSDTVDGGAGRDHVIHDGNTAGQDIITIDVGADDDIVELRSLLYSGDGWHRHDIRLGEGNDRLLVTNIGTRGVNVSLGAGDDYVWLSRDLAGPLVQGNLVIRDFETGAGGDVLDLADYAASFFRGETGTVRLLQAGEDVVVQLRRPEASGYESLLVLENTLASSFVFANLNVAFVTDTISPDPTQIVPSIIPTPVLGTVTTAVTQTIRSAAPVTVAANEVYYGFGTNYVFGEFRTLAILHAVDGAAFVNNGTIWHTQWSAPFESDTMGVGATGTFENNGLIYTEVQGGIARGAIINGNGINRGDIIARAGLEGPGIAISTGAQITFENSGLLAAQSYSSEAVGVDFINGGQLINRAGGEIIVEGVDAIAVRYGRGLQLRDGPEILNEGLIRAVSLDPERLSFGLDLAHLTFETMRVVNSGTISADVAIFVDSFAFAPPQLAREEVTNTATGRIEGLIFLSLGDDLLINQGTIDGDVLMGGGRDVFDSTGGRWTGDLIDLDFGDDVFRGSLDADYVVGGFGNDELSGAQGNDLLIGNNGNDILIGGAGNDGLYGEYGLDTLTLAGGDRAFGGAQDDTFILTDYAFAEARGEAGVDTLVLTQAPGRIFDLTAALSSGRLSGFERITLGATHGLVVRAGDVAALSDVESRLVVSEAAAGASVNLLGSWTQGAQQQIGSQTFNTFTLGSETVLVQTAIEVTRGGSAPAAARGLDAVASGAAAPSAGDRPGTARDLPVIVADGLPLFEDFVVAPWEVWTSSDGGLIFIPQPAFGTVLENYGVIVSESRTPGSPRAAAIQLENNNDLLNEGYVGAIANQTGSATTVLAIGINRIGNNGVIEALTGQGRAIAVITGASDNAQIPALTNGGEIYAESTAGAAIAAYVRSTSNVVNSGDIIARGATAATAVLIDQSFVNFTNSGDVIARTSTDAGTAIAFDIFFAGQLEVTNTGLIEGDDYAFRAINIGNPAFVILTNNGEIRGDFLVTGSSNNITNAGLIEGDLTFGTFADTYDGAGGTHRGTVSGGGGNDQLRGTAGTDRFFGDGGNDTLQGRGGVDFLNGGGGNDTLDGGADVDTAVVRGLRSAYTITQTATGVFRVVGADGTDTLTAIEFLQFDDQILRLRPGTGVTVNFNTADRTVYQSAMNAIRDFDGNALGGNGSWLRIGQADVNGDGDIDQLLVNRAIGRFATVGTAPDGLVYFSDHGWAGETRVAGTYIDPLVAAGIVQAGGPNDSQRRFQNDLRIENINRVLGADDYDNDGAQEVYFALNDGTAYLRALMHADGNIQYANYQSQQEVIDYLTANGFGPDTWAGWFTRPSSGEVGFDGEFGQLLEQIAIIGGLGEGVVGVSGHLSGQFGLNDPVLFAEF